MLRSLVVAVATMLVLSVLAATAQATTPRPMVVSVKAIPGQIPKGGGQVHVDGAVHGATTCRIVVLRDYGVKVVPPPPASCEDGVYREVVGFGPNIGEVPVVVELGLEARTARLGQALGVFYVTVAGTKAIAPSQVGEQLPPGVTVSVRETHATPPSRARTPASAPGAPTLVRSFQVYIHYAPSAPAPSSPSLGPWRLTFYNAQEQAVATAAYHITSCQHLLVSFSRPVPESVTLYLGTQQKWAKKGWVPVGGDLWPLNSYGPGAFTITGSNSEQDGATSVIVTLTKTGSQTKVKHWTEPVVSVAGTASC